eukprot:scaffold32011_cov169-Isochrysis_galbana.AAC.1
MCCALCCDAAPRVSTGGSTGLEHPAPAPAPHPTAYCAEPVQPCGERVMFSVFIIARQRQTDRRTDRGTRRHYADKNKKITDITIAR